MTAARTAGVTRVITVGDTVAASRWCVQAAETHPDVYAAVAVHPTEIADLNESGYAELAELAAHPRVVVIRGEYARLTVRRIERQDPAILVVGGSRHQHRLAAVLRPHRLEQLHVPILRARRSSVVSLAGRGRAGRSALAVAR